MGICLYLSCVLVPNLLTRSSIPRIRYKLTKIGHLGGGRTEARALNNKGQVTGKSYIGQKGPNYPFIWSADEGITNLGVIGGTNTGVGMDIDDRGRVAGVMYAPNQPEGVPFVWDATSGLSDLRGSDGVGGSLVATNAWGHAVGDVVSETTTTTAQPFFWTREGGRVYLGSLGGAYQRVKDVNDKDQVVGESNTGKRRADGTPIAHAFVWTATDGIRDLTPPGSDRSKAQAINNKGQMVGSLTLSNGIAHAFLWEGKQEGVDLAPGSADISAAEDINEVGQIVGWRKSRTILIRIGDRLTHWGIGDWLTNLGMNVLPNTTWDAEQYAVVFQDGNTIDLNDLIVDDRIWNLTYAMAINDRGEILVKGVCEGETKYALLTPFDPEG